MHNLSTEVSTEVVYVVHARLANYSDIDVLHCQ